MRARARKLRLGVVSGEVADVATDAVTVPLGVAESASARVPVVGAGASPADRGKRLDDLLLARYAPPGVLVNSKLDVIQFRGQTGAYLQPAAGEPQTNLMKMARPGLLATLEPTLARARKEMAPVRTSGVEIDQDGFTRACDLLVLPLGESPPSDEPLFVMLFEDITPPETSSERKPRRRSRRTTPVESAASQDPKQRLNDELISVNDELRNRNLEVSQINADLVNLLETVDIPIVILDKHKYIRRFTSQARHIMNVLPSDVGRLFNDIELNVVAPDLDAQIGEVIATAVARESEIQDADGRWYRMQVRPSMGAAGTVDGAIVSLLDINAFKHHLVVAERAKEEAQRADQAKDEFLAVLSHELRTPLSALLMQSQLLRRAGSDVAKRDRACEAIEHSTKIQAQLIDDLLDVSRIVTGKMRIELVPLELIAIVETVLDNVAALAESRSIELTSSLDRSLGPVCGDRTRLEQVISNLLINALKFTPRSGRVEVRLERASGQAQLTVTDTGMGIESEFLPHIFKRLIQKDSSSTRRHAGLGLGLAIVHHLVAAHGGSVDAESAGAGHGSTFRVALPLMATPSQPPVRDVPPARDVSPPGGSVVAGRLARRRALVLDDDTAIREALGEMLTEAGMEVRAAESVATGLVMFQEFHPDVVLCDIAMPEQDGYLFIRTIRALTPAQGGDVPAVALTALAADTDRRRALEEGFQLHLVKPVDMDHLAGAVAHLLEGGRLARSPSAQGSLG